MKLIQIFSISLFILITCQFCKPAKQIVGSKLLQDRCSNDTNHHYLCYIPSHNTECIAMPLVIVIDPHGSGSTAISKFKEMAEKYKCIIVASNLIKNNFPDYITAIEQLISDAKNKLPVNESVFISGFSGGARMAISFSQTHHLDGILACGALTSNDQLKVNKTPIYSIMGMTDFNFPEIARFIIYPDSKPGDLFLEIAGDIHEWPSSSDLSGGLGSLICYSASKNNSCISKKNILKEFENLNIRKIDSLILKMDFMQALLICNNILQLPDITNKKYFKEKSDYIKKNPDYLNEFQQFKKSLVFEMKLREAYYNALLTAEPNWWKKELAVLNKQIMYETDKYNLYTYKRIKAYLGILCYSVCNNSFQNNDLISVSKVLIIYKLVEPLNSDMLYFSAFYFLKKGNTDQAEILLHKSIEAGYTDTMLIRQNFPYKIVSKVF